MKNFLAIIMGAGIISVGIYFGLQNNGKTPAVDDYSNVLKNNGTVANTIVNAGGCGASNNTIVTKVIDGDTVVVEGGFHIRLLGMDADEKNYPCYDQAKTRLEELVLGKNVILEKDKTDADQYGRCLRYIFVGATNVDVQLVKEGLAVARFYNDVKYKTEITQAEKQAQQNKQGCKWAP